MKRFDELSVYNRLIQRLQVKEEWANVLGVGTLGNLIHTISEGNAEIARYLEYLYNEKKWRNARNMTSLTHQADLIAYKRQLPKSAVGVIIVSHTDINGIERLSNYGVTFFDLDQSSDFDNLVQNEGASYVERTALVPWTASERYAIPVNTIFKTNSGASFFSLETVESRSLKEPFSLIKSDEIKYADFIKTGGWNGIKYIKVPVIQGELTTINFGTARGTRFESFAIDSIQVEAGSNIVSNQFFKVLVSPAGNPNNVEIWEKVHNIKLAEPYDRVFEVKILNNENRVLIKFGDGITGRMLPKGAAVAVEYIETMGLSGNVPERFQIVSMTLPNNQVLVDPRTNAPTPFLQCTNILPIMGGKDIEDEDEIRVNAPPSYLQSYSIATINSYYEQIMKNSPVNLLHCKVFSSTVFSVDSFGRMAGINEHVSNIENSVLQEISMHKNTLLITAIKANGEKLDDPYNELINPIIKSFLNIKSPNDSFDYIEPNFIEIRPNILVNTRETLTEDEIRDKIMPNILNRYDIFNTDFDKPYYKSDVIDIVQDSLVSTYPEVFLEAKANVIQTPIILTETSNSDINSLLCFQFNFDQIFAQNRLNAGFKNFKVKAPYLLRLDLLFDEGNSHKNRSLFLFDERVHLQNEVTLLEAEIMPINSQIGVPSIDIVKNFENFSEEIVFVNKYSENFYNQQSRTAQFNYIEKITTPSYVYQMRQFNIEPFEIRPLYVNEFGRNEIFNTSDVEQFDRVSLSFETNQSSMGIQCYKRNTQFIDNCKIMFYENYANPEMPQYASGFLIIPSNYIFNREDISEGGWLYGNDLKEIAERMMLIIKDRLIIDVYAQPIEDNFNCNNEYDIIFSKREDILIQKQYLNI